MSLVDPDNRRPVDFEHRSRLLDEVDAVLATEPEARRAVIAAWLKTWRDGRIKLLITAAGLRLRRALPHLMLGGGYLPLATEVSVPAGAVGFARTAGPGDTEAVLFLAPRLCNGLAATGYPVPLGGECWKTSRVMLPPGLRDRTFRDVVTGAEILPTRAGENAWICLGDALQVLPVAMLRAT